MENETKESSDLEHLEDIDFKILSAHTNTGFPQSNCIRTNWSTQDVGRLIGKGPRAALGVRKHPLSSSLRQMLDLWSDLR